MICKFSSFRSKSIVDDLFERYMCLPVDEDEAANIIYEQRKLNLGRPKGQFELFYAELDSMLEEFGRAAKEMRASMAAHLPFAVSIPVLIQKVRYPL